MPNSNQPLSNARIGGLQGIEIVGLDVLRQHEEVDPKHLFRLKGEIESDGVIKFPIAVDIGTNIILDGQHRFRALKELNCRRIPVVFVDYKSSRILVQAWRRAEAYSKEDVRSAGLGHQKLPPTTTKHMIRICRELQHISAIQEQVNIPLETLRCEKDDCR